MNLWTIVRTTLQWPLNGHSMAIWQEIDKTWSVCSDDSSNAPSMVLKWSSKHFWTRTWPNLKFLLNDHLNKLFNGHWRDVQWQLNLDLKWATILVVFGLKQNFKYLQVISSFVKFLQESWSNLKHNWSLIEWPLEVAMETCSFHCQVKLEWLSEEELKFHQFSFKGLEVTWSDLKFF